MVPAEWPSTSSGLSLPSPISALVQLGLIHPGFRDVHVTRPGPCEPRLGFCWTGTGSFLLLNGTSLSSALPGPLGHCTEGLPEKEEISRAK
jgi:hypothetical protein